MLINTGTLTSQSLEGLVAVVTGAGRGIGFETARSLVWLGAHVVVAEIDEKTGLYAEKSIANEFGAEHVLFVPTDVGDGQSVADLKESVFSHFGKVDIIINNATVTPMGAVKDLPMEAWDTSYRVNLRGPVLLTKAFLPEMLNRRQGVIVCVSSVGQAYMGAYETFKSAQSQLAETLDAELEGTGVFAFTVSPGLVRTPGALASIKELAPLYGKTIEEFFAMSEEHLISAEAAGAGFAAAVVFAEKYQGQEVSSRQALLEAGIKIESPQSDREGTPFSVQQSEKALVQTRTIRSTLAEQSEGWKARSFFERQWMLRDFKKHAGMSVERWLELLEHFEQKLAQTETTGSINEVPPLEQLMAFYAHLADLAAGYEKDPQKRAQNVKMIEGWRAEVKNLISILTG